MGEDLLKHYNDIFSDEDKIKAFDILANLYYAKNFGTIQKADLDVLMFSVYLDQVLAKYANQNDGETKFNEFSDYKLSKNLGITQTKISNLKIKKQLRFPVAYSWQTSFNQLIKKASYENGKIVIHIPDRNLYLEIKNAIEEKGGYVDVTLNTNLLKVSPAYFIDLMLACNNNNEYKNDLKKKLRNVVRENDDLTDYIEEEKIGDKLKYAAIETVCSLIKEIPLVGTFVSELIR